jgi:Transcriptional regulator
MHSVGEYRHQKPSMLTEKRPDEQERLLQIHETALRAFACNGYAGTSMTSIARAIGGSKTTLYRRYPSKKELFLAVLRTEMDRFFASVRRFSTGTNDFAQSLYDHCQCFARTAQSRDAIAAFRLLIAECPRLPELQAEYNARVDNHIATLTEAIETCAQNAALPPLNWNSAARLLFDLNKNFLFNKLQDETPIQDAASERDRHAKSVLDVFLTLI